MIPANSPFKLLQSYEKGDINLFFGREKETRQLYKALMRSKFMLVYGASGTGKTSLIQCGLQGMFSPRDWLPIFIRRQDHFLGSLREELERHYLERFEDFRAQQLDWYPEDPVPKPETFDSLRDLIKELFKLSYVPIYLILDQFEEIFTLGSRSEQDEFFQALDELDLFSEDLFCKIMLVTREEYIAHFYRYEKQLPFLFENRYRVEKMREEQLLTAVNGTLTASYEGYPRFEVRPGTPEKILDNLADKRGEVDLTTLQVYLDRLYQEDTKRMNGRDHLLFDPKLVGGHKLENILSDFLDEQVARVMVKLHQRLPEEETLIEHNLPMQVLFQLVTGEGTKQNRSAEEIRRELEVGKTIATLLLVEACLEEFASSDSRILNRLRFAKTADERYEIVHDRLAEQIFKKFSTQELRRREAITTIRNKLKRYKEALTAKAQRQEYLSVGELELISQSINIKALGEDMDELKQFYEDSRNYHTTQRRRRRAVTIVSIVASIVFLTVAVYAYFQSVVAQENAELAQRNERAAQQNLAEARRNLLKVDLAKYGEIIRRADNYLALNSPEFALPEYQYALLYRQDSILDVYHDTILKEAKLLFQDDVQLKIDSLHEALNINQSSKLQ